MTVAAEQLLDGEAENLTRKAIELALDGNLAALRLCLDRILPARRDRPLQLDLPKLQSLEDAEEATTRIVAAVGSGEIGISDATEMAKLVELYVRAREARVREIDAEIRRIQEEDDRRAANNGGVRRR